MGCEWEKMMAWLMAAKKVVDKVAELVAELVDKTVVLMDDYLDGKRGD